MSEEHVHEIGKIDESECVCGALHIYCESCMARMNACPIYDSPDALRKILDLCAPGQHTSPEAAALAESVHDIATKGLYGDPRRDQA